MGFLGFGGPSDDELNKYAQQKAQDQAAADAQKAEMERLRQQKKDTSLNLLGQMQGPQQADAQKRRIAALEEESQAGPLSQDANFQGDRARLVQGGQQALSGVQNTQRGAGTSGGFSNQGSIQDVYDRLGSQMAQLGQQSQHMKEEKRGSAADMQQAFVDAQTQFANAQNNAKIAIEQGDADSAAAYLQQAYQARQALENTYRQQVQGAEQRAAASRGAVLGAGATIAGAALGGPLGGALGSALGGAAGGAAASAAPQADYFNQPYQMPTYAQLRSR